MSDNKKKRYALLTNIILILSILFTSFTLVFDIPTVSADIVGAEFGNSNYTYLEDFEDEGLGVHPTSEDWYTFYNGTVDGANIDTYVYTVNSPVYAGSRAYEIDAPAGSNAYWFYHFNRSGVDLDFINLKFRMTTSSQMTMRVYTYSGGEVMRLMWGYGTGTKIHFDDDIGSTTGF